MKRTTRSFITITILSLLHILCSDATGPSSNQSRWRPANNGLPENATVNAIAHVTGTGTLYVGTFSGVYQTIDNGENWAQLNDGLASLDISALAADGDDRVFAGTWGNGVFKTSHGTGKWETVWNNSQSPHINHLVIANDNSVWAATEHGLFKSVDAGASWLHVFNYGKVRTVNIHPSHANVVYIGVRWHGNFRSRDAGATWQSINNGIYTDGQDVASANRFLFHPNDPTKMFMSTGWVDLYYTDDSGDTWELTASQLTELSVLGLDNALNNPEGLWALTDKDGIYFSENGSKSWMQRNDGLEGIKAKSLSVTGISQETIFVGTLGKGIYRYAIK